MKKNCMMILLFILSSHTSFGDDFEKLKVGLQADGRIVVPTNQVIKPAGQQVVFSGRPVDLEWIENGKTIVVKNMKNLLFIDADNGNIRQTLELPDVKKGEEKISFGVVGLIADGDRIFVTDAQQRLWIATRKNTTQYHFEEPIVFDKGKLQGSLDPAGISRLTEQQFFVTTTRNNSVQLVNTNTRKVEQVIPVGVSPYQVVVKNSNRAYVSNWGGDHPKETDSQKLSSGTAVRIDPRTSVANMGTVSVLDNVDGTWKQVKSIAVGLHASGMLLSQNWLFVANANSDTISIIDTTTDTVVETISCRPESRLPFGSASNALSLSLDRKILYVANGTNNCIAVIRLAAHYSEEIKLERNETSVVVGMIPTGWYPGAVKISPDGKKIGIANVKGHGSLKSPRAIEKGRNSHDHMGSVSIVELPNQEKLATYTREVNDNNRLNYSLAGLDKPRTDVKPIVVPMRHGEPSLIKNVIYIIKENRTYDQVFGDMKEGNGEPSLCIFGEEATPNHHQLARDYTLLDNFYCSGILSADGHSWTDSAYVTDYLEKAFGNFSRSYPDDGRDPLAFAPTGFIWDNALAHKKTIRNYGEFVSEEPYFPLGTKWKDFYDDHKNGTRNTKVTIKFNNKALEPHTHPTYPYFPLHMPDVYRADLFIEDFKKFEKAGSLPNLIIMSLPCDHTEGTKPDFPTPRAMVADNDLALGRIVETVSKSQFWKDTCILVVEDDPQNGFDHVDGHRTVALAISPYTKRKYVDHTQYNQTGMVKTIELMLGLPPMNQMDLSATPMRNCFQNEPNLTPYKLVTNRISLDEMNPPLKALKGQAKYWAQKSIELNLEEGDKADEDTFNRIIWHSIRGDNVPYPQHYIRNYQQK